MKEIFVLGAKDPEMDDIEEILLSAKLDYVYASINGVRCHPGNSYEANNESYMANNDLSKYKKIVYIESATIKKYNNSIFLDHHKEGHFGFEFTYKDFLPASSIGQLIKYLIDNDISLFKKTNINSNKFLFQNNEWSYENQIILKKYVFSAAVDHSLSESYKGLCQGVNTSEVSEYRTSQIAVSFNNNIDLVHKTMAKYLNNFKSHSNEIRDFTNLDLGTGYSIDYLCFRELAILYCQPVVVKTKDSEESPIRLMFLSLTVEMSEKLLTDGFFNEYIFKSSFGVPNRGYVGAFL